MSPRNADRKSGWIASILKAPKSALLSSPSRTRASIDASEPWLTAMDRRHIHCLSGNAGGVESDMQILRKNKQSPTAATADQAHSARGFRRVGAAGFAEEQLATASASLTIWLRVSCSSRRAN